MKTSIIALCLILSISLNNTYSQTINSDFNTPFLEFLEDFNKEYSNAFLMEKPETIIKYYSEEIRLMPEFQKTIFTKENALAYFIAFFERFNIKSYDRKNIEVLDLGMQIVELGYFTLTFVDLEREYNLEGKYQNIWNKTSNSKPELLTEAWNYNHSVDFADQLRFEDVSSVHMALQEHLPVNDNLSFEIAALNTLMEKTIVEADAKIWSQFFSDDAMFIYSFNPIYKGRVELDSYIERHTQELPVFEHLDIRTDKIEDLGEFVIEYATHIANWRNGEFSGVSTGKNLRIWRREKSGPLKIFRQIAMYD